MGRLAQAAETATTTRSLPGGTCTFATLFDDLDDEDADELQAFLSAKSSHQWLAEKISQAFDVKVAAETVSRHRRGLCACG